MANKQINQLPAGTTPIQGTDNLPSQDINDVTKKVSIQDIANFIGTSTTPGLPDVLEADNYADGFNIILNNSSKIKSDNQTGGVDQLEMNSGYINLVSYDGAYDSTNIYSAPTETGIRKNNTQTGNPIAKITLDQDKIILRTDSLDGTVNQEINYNVNGNNAEAINFQGNIGQSRITKNTTMNDNSAYVQTSHYVKDDTGEYELNKREDSTIFTTNVTDYTINNTTILQRKDVLQLNATDVSVSKQSGINIEPTFVSLQSSDGFITSSFNIENDEINSSSRRLFLITAVSAIQDNGQSLAISSNNLLNLQSNIISLNQSSSANLSLLINGLQVYNNNAAALSAGLVTGEVYRKSSGELMIVH